MSSHRLAHRKFHRTKGHRRSLFANQAASLIEHEQIVTTLPKAKNLRPIVEKLITIGKKGGLHAKRQLLSFLMNNEKAAEKAMKLGERYKARNGGYLRIIKAGFRHGDAAPIAVIEFVDRDVNEKGKNDRLKVAEEKKAKESENAASAA